MNKSIFFIFLIFFLTVNCELSEKEMEDLEFDMMIAFRNSSMTREQEAEAQKIICNYNYTKEEYERAAHYCFDKILSKAPCVKCKDITVESVTECSKKVPLINGCDEINMHKREACQMEHYETNRMKYLEIFKEFKLEYVNLMNKLKSCYKDILSDKVRF